MKKKVLTLVFSLWLLIASLPILSVAAAEGSLSMKASATAVTVGDSVTVTVTFKADTGKIASIYSTVNYSTSAVSLNLEASKGPDGATIAGDAGRTTLMFESPSSGVLPTEVTYTLAFKTVAVGDATISLSTGEFNGCANEASVMQSYSLGSPSGSVTVAASNPTLSGNANLSSLKPTKGTLTPKFDPDVTSYRVSVSHSVESLTLIATAAQEGATHRVDGSSTLKVGQNTFTVTVTAPNGTTKKYTVVVTRAAAPSSTTGTTQPPPAEDALDVEVDGKVMTILDTQASSLPAGFSWSSVTINRVEVPAAVNEQGMTLLYLVTEDDSDEGFFIYDAAADSFTRYRALTVKGGTWLLYDAPDKAFTGTVRGELNYDGGSVSAYVYEDLSMSDFYIVWAEAADGTAGWYTYDAKEGTLQRYHTVAGEVVEVWPSTTTTKKPQKTTTQKAEKDTLAIGEFFTSNAKVLLIGAIVLAGAVVVIVAVMILVSLRSRRRGKH